jgi:hypothetical protein
MRLVCERPEKVVELGEDYWSYTGLDMDERVFQTVRLDEDENMLVWENRYSFIGEALHAAIVEGRM